MILDARRVNQRFRPPPRVDLCSSEGLARVELELPDYVDAASLAGRAILDEVRIHLGNGDVKDVFHRFRLTESLAAYFCMGTAKAHELGLTGSELHGRTLGDVDTVDICWAPCLWAFPGRFCFANTWCRTLLSSH